MYEIDFQVLALCLALVWVPLGLVCWQWYRVVKTEIGIM